MITTTIPTRSNPAIQFNRDERGMLSQAHLLITLFLTVLIVCIWNVGTRLSDRTVEQQKADLVAQSLGTWKARNMNAVTAHQHLMGEMFGMIVIHHALGGDRLEQKKKADTSREDAKLVAAHRLIPPKSNPGTPAFESVRQPIYVDRALYKGYVELKELLTKVYYARILAEALKAFPPTKPAGIKLEEIAYAVELKIEDEWRVLRQIQSNAEATLAEKQRLKEALRRSRAELVKLIDDYPRSQRELIEELERKWEIKIHVLPTDTQLPVKPDPLAKLSAPPSDWKRPDDCECVTDDDVNLRHQMAKVSQLARAAFPWVNYHRQALVEKMRDEAILSKIGDHYYDEAAGTCRDLADLYQRSDDYVLFALEDYEGPDKAMESWTKEEGAGNADRSFGITTLVGTPARRPAGDFLFQVANRPWDYRVSSALVWNRIAPQKPEHRIDLYCKRITPSVQAETGWDLLNWKKGTDPSELVGFGIPHVFPAIEPVWTSQMTPTSAARVKQLREQSLPDWAKEAKDLLPSQFSANAIVL